ncbi:MAG: aminoglycoside phosphotransferase family protein [Oscillospiraceae bacterium]|nr:aminoglycoside phosphotransferase family protein [Oscillospiraceae bacterium]
MHDLLTAFGLPQDGTFTVLSGGHIHRTLRYAWNGGSVILQRLHPSAFPDPHALMQNLRLVTRRLTACSIPTLHYLSCTDGTALFTDAQGGCWRAMDDLGTCPGTPDPYAAGLALGRFQKALDGLEGLVPVSPGFHDTARYFDALDALCRTRVLTPAQQRLAGALLPLREAACALQGLPLRTVHGDPKAENFFPAPAPVLLDLDTVMYAPAGYDLGDAVRSLCTVNGIPDRAMQERLTAGFLEGAGHLTPAERRTLSDAPFCVTAELSVRYLTDAVQGGTYFGLPPEDCLARAQARFRLAEAFLSVSHSNF